MALGRCEINRKTEVRADAARPRDDPGVFNSDLYQEPVKSLSHVSRSLDGVAASA
jgi:hypothetical protein